MDLAAGQRERAATLLANAVAASLAGADEAATAPRLALWQREHGALREVRVIAGRELRASTVPADEAPRAEARREPPLRPGAGTARGRRDQRQRRRGAQRRCASSTPATPAVRAAISSSACRCARRTASRAWCRRACGWPMALAPMPALRPVPAARRRGRSQPCWSLPRSCSAPCCRSTASGASTSGAASKVVLLLAAAA
ncbi:MAG: hypothetical protein U1F25_10725 [Rubrivivax sp.]